MPDYSKGKIYRLVGGGLTYYGSTVNELRYRLKQHKNDFKYQIRKTSSKLLFEIGDEVKIFLVEKFPCNDRMELNARERYWIENNECVNKNIPTRTDKEYRDANKEQIKERDKQYKEANKEQIKEYHKEYYEANKDQILEKEKQYYEANKDKILKRISEKITCECGAIIRKGNILRHRTSKRHILSTTE